MSASAGWHALRAYSERLTGRRCARWMDRNRSGYPLSDSRLIVHERSRVQAGRIEFSFCCTGNTMSGRGSAGIGLAAVHKIGRVGCICTSM